MNTVEVPEHGWVVICEAMQQFAIARDEESLAWMVGTFEEQVWRTMPDAENPVRIFEIGRDLSPDLQTLMATLQRRS